MPCAEGAKLEQLRPVIVSGNVECHLLPPDAAQVELGDETARRVIHGFHDVRAIGTDDGATTPKDPLVG